MTQKEDRALGYGGQFIQAVGAMRGILRDAGKPHGLRDTLDFMANEFGFKSWDTWRNWLQSNQLDFSLVTGPHALTILKMIAIKHGRAKRD